MNLIIAGLKSVPFDLSGRDLDIGNIDLKTLALISVIAGGAILALAFFYSLLFGIRRARKELERINERGTIDGLYQKTKAEQTTSNLQKELLEKTSKSKTRFTLFKGKESAAGKELAVYPRSGEEKEYSEARSPAESEYGTAILEHMESGGSKPLDAAVTESEDFSTSILEDSPKPVSVDEDFPTSLLDGMLQESPCVIDTPTALLGEEELATSLLEAAAEERTQNKSKNIKKFRRNRK